ncbi:MAG: insulinase family protein [Neomegalonema sp.]|nr:insulinase family protein [Neomegalonema sp.]
MPGLASTTLGIWVAAGSRHETEPENGLAHFLEHMAFKGTHQRSARQIAEEIEDVGGYLNAYTSREATAYYARVLAEDSPRALDLLGDILRNPVFNAEDIEVERGVILQEIGQCHDTPDDVVFDWAQECAYPDQAMGRPILGPSTNIAAFQRDALEGFMRRRYAPDRMIVAAAGAIDHDSFAALVKERFAGIGCFDGGGSDAARYVGGEHRVEKDLEQAHLVLGFEAPSYRDPDFFAAQIYATVLGGGMSSRLFQEVREQRGLCYTISASPAHYADTGILSIYAGTGGDQLRELIDVSLDQMRSVVDTVSDAEIARARAQIRAGLLMGLETPSSRCERLSRSLMAHGRIVPVAELLEKIDAVDKAAIARFGEQLLTGNLPTLTLYGPVAAAHGVEEIQARLAA